MTFAGGTLRLPGIPMPLSLASILKGMAFFTALMLVVSLAREASALLLLLMVLGGLLALPHAIRLARGTWEAFDPLVAFTMICGMGYFFRSVHLLWHERLDLYHIPIDTLDALELLAAAVALVILSVLSFYAGYGSPIASAAAASTPVLSNEWSRKRLRLVWVAFTLIGGAAYFSFVMKGGGLLHIMTNMEMRSEISAGSHIYYMIIRLMPMALLFRQVLLIRSNASRLAWLSFSLHVLAVVVLLALLGSRSWAFEVLFMVLVVRHYLHRPVRMRSLVLLVVTSLIIFAVFHQYRNLTHDGFEAGELKQMELEDFDTFYNGILGHRNFDMMDNLLSVIRFTDDRFEYLEGSSYLHFFVNMVPRSLWEGKPVGVGSLLVEEVYGWGFGGAPPGAIGEAYLNYSWLGVVPSLILMGLFARFVAAYAAANRKNPFAIFLLAIAFIFVLMVTRGSFYKVGSTFMMRAVPLLIGALIVCKGRRQIKRPVSAH